MGGIFYRKVGFVLLGVISLLLLSLSLPVDTHGCCPLEGRVCVAHTGPAIAS